MSARDSRKNIFPCWWCTYFFNNTPCRIKDYTSDTFYGNFCSYNCAIAYLYKSDKFGKEQEISFLLNEVYKKLNKPLKIEPSLPKERLNKYIANGIDIRTYRKKFIFND